MPCPSRSVGAVVAALALTTTLGLGGCGGGETVSQAIGYEQAGPDEMTVIKRPPLTVPPDFNLRPPRPDEPRSEADDASKAAKETLIGPSSELAPAATEKPEATLVKATTSPEPTSAGDRAKATLTGQKVAAAKEEDWQRYHKTPPLLNQEEEVAAATIEGTPSAGEIALLSRTNRVERDLDALNETRDENRVDGALLRRLLAWEPTPKEAAEQGTDGDLEAEAESVVQITRREQTPVSAGNSLE